jgi:hypothetical protein
MVNRCTEPGRRALGFVFRVFVCVARSLSNPAADHDWIGRASPHGTCAETIPTHMEVAG